MGFGASLVLMAAGAILWWAVDVATEGVDLNMVGVILFVVGAIGLALSLIFWSSWGGAGPWRRAGYGEPVDYVEAPPRERVRDRVVDRY